MDEEKDLVAILEEFYPPHSPIREITRGEWYLIDFRYDPVMVHICKPHLWKKLEEGIGESILVRAKNKECVSCHKRLSRTEHLMVQFLMLGRMLS